MIVSIINLPFFSPHPYSRNIIILKTEMFLVPV